MAKGIPSVQSELEGRIEALGLELVDSFNDHTVIARVLQFCREAAASG